MTDVADGKYGNETVPLTEPAEEREIFERVLTSKPSMGKSCNVSQEMNLKIFNAVKYKKK